MAGTIREKHEPIDGTETRARRGGSPTRIEIRMKALVTGGGGFLGKRIVDRLLQRGDAVRVLGRRPYPDLEQRGVDCRQGDIRDIDAVRAACEGMDTVFHVAALAGVWGPPREYYEINVRGTANVLQACREAKVQRLIYTSSPSVVIADRDIEGGSESLPYPDAYLATYPDSKARAEKIVLDANGWEMVPNTAADDVPAAGENNVTILRTCALRPHLIWGPGDPHLVPRIIDSARKGKLAIVGNGSNRVDITYVDNAAYAHLLAADDLAGPGNCAGKAYFINDAEPVVLWEWINRLLERTGVPRITRRIPYRLARGVGAVLEVLHRLVPALGEPRMTRFVAVQLAKSHWFRSTRAREDFGYRPIVSPEQGMQALFAWLEHQQPENHSGS